MSDSDTSIIGYDPAYGEWVVAKRSKKNRKSVNRERKTGEQRDADGIAQFCDNEDGHRIGLIGSERRKLGSLCGTCQTGVCDNDRTLECEVCLVQYHVKCQSVSAKLYEALQDNGGCCAWYCQACREGVKQLRLQIIALQRDQLSIKASVDRVVVQANQNSSEVALLKSDLTETEKRLEKYNSEMLSGLDTIILKSTVSNAETDGRISALQANIEKRLDQLEKLSGSTSSGPVVPRSYAEAAGGMEALENRLDELAAVVKSNQAKTTATDTRALKRGLTELEDIESRKLNLVVFNLPEAGSTDDDINAFKELIKSEFNLSVKLQAAIRLGRKSDARPRMLRVTLEEGSERKLILAKARYLRASESEVHAKVFIRPDLTKSQLEHSKNLSAQLQEKRAAFPDKKWMIKRSEIVEVTT